MSALFARITFVEDIDALEGDTFESVMGMLGTVYANANLKKPNEARFAICKEGATLPKQHKAQKISAGELTTGQDVVIYFGVRNQDATQYLYSYYAISKNGKIVPIQDTGDNITYWDSQRNDLEWHFQTMANNYCQFLDGALTMGLGRC